MNGFGDALLTKIPDIAISQITWLYVLVLPFQLYQKLHWVTIPGTIVAGMSLFSTSRVIIRASNLATTTGFTLI